MNKCVTLDWLEDYCRKESFCTSSLEKHRFVCVIDLIKAARKKAVKGSDRTTL